MNIVSHTRWRQEPRGSALLPAGGGAALAGAGGGARDVTAGARRARPARRRAATDRHRRPASTPARAGLSFFSTKNSANEELKSQVYGSNYKN